MLKEKHTLSAATYHDIMQNLIKMLSHLQCFYAVENDVETSPHVTVIDFESLWVSMRKQSVFKSFCRNIGYIEPKQVTTLVSYIFHEDVFGSMIASQANYHLDAHLLSDYTNGEYLKKNSYFKGNPSLLRLHLFCDEVEVCNPIGSSKGLHKLVCVYILGNIETRYWSMLSNIHVAAVAKSLIVQNHGYKSILGKLSADLVCLENDGILVKLSDGTSRVFYGGVATLSGDNLSSHEIGGFRRCFSNGLICRTCLCSYENIKNKMHESCFTLRSPEAHTYYVDSVMKDNSLVSVYGVRCGCPLQKLQSFDLIQALPPDIMHDILEEIVPIVLNAIIEHLHESKILSKNAFGQHLNKFQFGNNESKK